MTQTTTIKNTKNTKTRVTLTLISLILALMAAVAIQSPAIAETGQIPSTPRDSLGTGQPELKSKPKPGRAVGTRTKPGGGMHASSIVTGTSGRPGSLISAGQIIGTPYQYGDQLLSWVGAEINRSPSYSGTQVITITHKIYKYNRNTGIWDPFIFPYSSITTYPGQHAKMPNRIVSSLDTSDNYYYADIEIKWRTTGGQLIAAQNHRTAYGSDYLCNPQLYWHTCRSGGTQGSLVWLYMSV